MPEEIPRPIGPEPVIRPRPVPQYSRGGDLSKVPRAADTRPADLTQILAVDTANPFLRQLRIQQGLLKESDVDPTMLKRVPITVDNEAEGK